MITLALLSMTDTNFHQFTAFVMSQAPTPPTSAPTLAQPGTANAPQPVLPLQLTSAIVASSPLPAAFLGTINPAAQRRFYFPASSQLRSAMGDVDKIQSWDVVSSSRFKSAAAGWSVVQVPRLRLELIPTHAAKSLYIEIVYTWVPKGEDIPTSVDDMWAFQLTVRRSMFPAMTGGVAQPLAIDAPIGMADLGSAIKPKPVAGGHPILVTALSCYDADGKFVSSRDLAYVQFDFDLRLGA
uniref:Uncharacterized protein n=1 Tax=Douglas' Neckera Moss associated tymo-like virus TaxID=2933168 RepID=A0A9C7GWM2_9VIRU|nr:hypothetical protein [Douglas' Neckera Moss associated tymo-like virus]CAI5383950.1 hypothetical protein [Douglas' Neckera Moss associated tymo-like virus]